MKTLHTPRARMASLFALAVGAIAPQWADAQPAPLAPEAALEATIVNNRHEAIEAMVWVDGVLYKMGNLPAGERRTFTLPTSIREGARYYLLGARTGGSWITSDPLTASRGRERVFVVARPEQRSYVRFAQAPRTDVAP